MAGIGPNPDDRAASSAAPVGVVSSTGRSRPQVGTPLQQADHGRGRVGQHAVGRPDHPGPGGHRAGPDLVDAEHLEGRRRAHDVDDRVVAAHLVEVDLVDRPAVEPASTSARPAKVASARAATRSGRRASSTSPTMWAWVRTTTWSWTETTARVAAIPPRSTGSTSSAQPPNGSRSSSASTSSRSAPASIRLPRAMSPAIPAKQWNQATAAVASTRRRRRVGSPAHGSIRATAQAAPKPLSIPTTVIPAAQEACMASRAVTPSRAAP